MTIKELKQAAMACLVKAFNGETTAATVEPHVVQAAVSVLMMPNE